MILSRARLNRTRDVIEGVARFEIRDPQRVWVQLQRDGSATLWLGRSASRMEPNGAELHARVPVEGYQMDIRVWREGDELRDGRKAQVWFVEFSG